MIGTRHDDTIRLDDEGDGATPRPVDARGGNDLIIGAGLPNPEPDFFCGGAGDDTMRGGYRDDLLIGGAGYDVAKGGLGVDLCLSVERKTGCENAQALARIAAGEDLFEFAAATRAVNLQTVSWTGDTIDGGYEDMTLEQIQAEDPDGNYVAGDVASGSDNDYAVSFAKVVFGGAEGAAGARATPQGECFVWTGWAGAVDDTCSGDEAADAPFVSGDPPGYYGASLRDRVARENAQFALDLAKVWSRDHADSFTGLTVIKMMLMEPGMVYTTSSPSSGPLVVSLTIEANAFYARVSNDDGATYCAAVVGGVDQSGVGTVADPDYCTGGWPA